MECWGYSNLNLNPIKNYELDLWRIRSWGALSIPDTWFRIPFLPSIVRGEVLGVNVRALGTDLSLGKKTKDAVKGYI